MAAFNQLQCQSRAGNTGIGRCTQSNAVEVGLFLIPKGSVITAANAADLKTFIAGKVHATLYAERWHPIGNFVEVTPQDSEETMTEYADGSQTVNRDAYYRTRYRHTKGDCFHASLVAFNGRENEFDVIAVDKMGRLIVVNKNNLTTGVPELGGQAVSRLKAPNKGKATFADAGTYYFDVDYADATEYNEQYATLQAQDSFGKNFNPLKWGQDNAVQDVIIQNTSTLVAGVVTLLFGTGCGQSSLGTIYALTAAMLTAKNKATGAAITITSLVASPAGAGQYVLTMDTGDADYPTSGNVLTIEMKDVATLAGIGPAWFESNILSLKVA